MSDDLYAVLGVSPDADDDGIKQAWRELARRLHPDRNPGDADAAEGFRRASAAWSILSDPDKRLVYDRFGIDAVRHGLVEDLARAVRAQESAPERAKPPEPTGRASNRREGGDVPRAEPGGRTRPGRTGPTAADVHIPAGTAWDADRTARRAPTGRREDVRAEIALTLREAARGGVRTVPIEDDGPCDRCDGSGRRASGRFCSACRGTGSVATVREVAVSVPVSVAAGQTLRLPYEGRRGPDGTRGTLFVDVIVRPDPVFRREGLSLHVEVALPADRVLEVPTLDGTVRMEAPPSARPGQTVRVIGQGMPGPEGRAPGDLYVTLR